MKYAFAPLFLDLAGKITSKTTMIDTSILYAYTAYLSVAFVAAVLITSAVFTLRGRKHKHREKRNARLIESILKPLAVPLKQSELTSARDGPIPEPSYKRFKINTFFRATGILLDRREKALFYGLRRNAFNLDEKDYTAQFQQGKLDGGGNLGFSGAAFFFTPGEKKYIVKSLPNEFEWKFFYNSLLVPYCEYMLAHKDTMLTRITDALFNFDLRFWNWLRLGTASHFLVMQNMLDGFDEEKGCRQWDLKPTEYLRADLLIPLSGEENEKLLFKKGGISFTQEQHDKFMEILARDTKFLADKKVVDYSLLLGRYPLEVGVALGEEKTFPGGVVSADGKYIYKIGIIDFFFSHKTAPAVVKNAGDIIPGDLEFTFTDAPSSYRKNFLEMAKDYIKIEEPSEMTKTLENALATC